MAGEPVESIPETSAAERAVADVLAIDAPAGDAERVRASVPLWFHTFALAPGVYTPGIARDHGYRLTGLRPSPTRCTGRRSWLGAWVLGVRWRTCASAGWWSV